MIMELDRNPDDFVERENSDSSPRVPGLSGGGRTTRPACRLLGRGFGLVTAIAFLSQDAAPQDPGRAQGPRSSGARPLARNSDPTGTTPPRRVPDELKFAHGLLRQRKFDLAAEEYQRYLGSHPAGLDRADAQFGLANARLYQGRYGEARRGFEEFLKVAPEDSRALTARYRLGELSYVAGDLPGARRLLEAYTATAGAHPGMETAWTYLGDVCFGLKDLPAAQRAYERSLSSYPQGRMAARARFGLGRTLAGLGRRDRALEVFRELTRSGGPEWVDQAWLEVGTIQQAAGQDAEVVAAMAALERAAPGSALRHEARFRRARALARLGREGEAEALWRAMAGDPAEPLGADAALELATLELEHNHPQAALATLEGAIPRFPRSALSAALQFRSAEALRKLGRLAEAEARFLRIVNDFPNDPWADDALQRAAQTAMDRGDPVTARRLAGQFAGRFPRSPLRDEVRLIEARAAAMAGEHRAAVALLESLLAPAHPGAPPQGSEPQASPAVVPSARYELALAYRALGRSAEAEAILARLAEGPSSPIAADAQFLIGQAHVDAGRSLQAIAPLEHYLAANPRGDVAEFALAQLAVAQLGAGRTDDAWKTLATLAERFPGSKALPPARLRLAEAALAAHQADRAVEPFRLVAGAGPVPSTDQPPRGSPAREQTGAPVDRSLRIRAFAGLGRALVELGKPAEAAAAFAAALELAPGDPIAPELALARGRALEAAGQADKALEAYALAADRFAQSDRGPQAALARARLLAKLGRHGDAAQAFERLGADAQAREAVAKAGTPSDALLAEWGWSLVDAAKPAAADTVFARLLNEHPESPFAIDARFNLAESAHLAGNPAEVIRLLAPLAARKPTGSRPSRTGTEPLHSAGTGPGAGGVSAAGLPSSSRRLLPAVLYRLGRTQVVLRDWAGASSTLDRLLEEFPDNPYRREARFLRAESALQSGETAAAESGFAALRAEPAADTDPPGFLRVVRLKQIQCWVVLKRWKEVLAAAQALRGELAANDPAIAELEYARGQAWLGQGRLEEARRAFQAVIEAPQPGELAAQAQLMRGETFYHEDRLREALREFLKVDILHEAPRWQAAALLEAGKVYERLQQWSDAAETYQRLVSQFPDDPTAAEARTRRDAASRRASARPVTP